MPRRRQGVEPKNSARAGIKRVAQEAGVSPATVSLVYNGKGQVAEATRTRVLDAGQRLGYRPNPLGQALQSGRSRVIGVVVSYRDSAVWEQTYLPYYRDVIAGAAMEAVEHGYSIAAVPSTAEGQVETQVPLDGVVVVDPGVGDPLVDFCMRQYAAVVTDGTLIDPPAGAVPLSVRADTSRGIADLLDHLSARHDALDPARPFAPGLLMGARLDSYSIDTVESFRAWCAERDLEAPVAAVATGDDPAAAARDLLAGGGVNALHCINETYGNAAIAAAHELGVEVPGRLQVSVRGNGAAVTLVPGATYLSIDSAVTGAMCARTLIAVLEGDDAVSSLLPYAIVDPPGS